jgi:Predicted transcriptional regulator with C-terminal CBS domains
MNRMETIDRHESTPTETDFCEFGTNQVTTREEPYSAACAVWPGGAMYRRGSSFSWYIRKSPIPSRGTYCSAHGIERRTGKKQMAESYIDELIERNMSDPEFSRAHEEEMVADEIRRRAAAVGEELRRRRKAMRLSKEAAARKLGVTSRQIDAIEALDPGVSAVEFIRYAGLLGFAMSPTSLRS